MASKQHWNTIFLTSPHAHGDHVKEAQFLLQDNNRWNHPFYTGAMDGDYGPATAAAARRAKWWLGYPEKNTIGQVGSSFGQYLRGYLIDKDHETALKLPVSYLVRHNYRLTHKPNWHAPAVELATKQVGTHELSDNYTSYNLWYYGQPISAAWCGIFVSWVIQHAGGPKWFKYAYVPDLVWEASRGTNSMAFVNSSGVAAGGVVCYDWDNDGVADHMELFDRWVDKAAGTFYAIGGNTGTDSQYVARQVRYLTNVQHFVHVP